MHIIITLSLSLSLSLYLSAFGQWGELRFQCPGFHTRLCASSVCVRVCACRVHVAAKYVNVNLQGTHTHRHGALLYWSV